MIQYAVSSLDPSTILTFLWYCVYVLVVFVVAVVLAAKITPSGYKKAQELDWPIELIAFVMSILTLLAGEFLFHIQSILYFGLIFGLTGLLVEFMGDWIWFQLMGSRLFIYYKKSFMGMTSMWNLPYWIFGGILFFSALYGFDLLNISFEPVSFVLYVLGFGALSLLVYVFVLAVIDGLDGIPNLDKGFTDKKYLLLPIFAWGGVVGASYMIGNSMLVLFFLISSILSFVGDGLLGQMLQIAFGEKYKLVSRKSAFSKSTSWYILPLWVVGGLMALLIWYSI